MARPHTSMVCWVLLPVGSNEIQHTPVITFLRTALAALILACSAPASAQDNQPQHDIAALVDESGLSTIIQSIPRSMSDSITNEDFIDLSDLSKNDIDTLKDILVGAFDAKLLEEDIENQLAGQYAPDRMTTVLNRFREPLSRKITELEKQANSPAAAQDFEQFVAGLSLHAPDPDRVELLKELDNVSHSTDIAILIQIEIAKTLVQSVSVFDGSRQPLSDDQMNDLVMALKDQLSTSVRNHILIWSLYAYRSLNNNDIKAYIALYRHKDMQWFIHISSTAMIKAMGHAAEQAGQSIATLRNAQQI